MGRGCAALIALAVAASAVSGCDGKHKEASSASDSTTLWRVAAQLARDDGARLISAQAVRTTRRAGAVFMASSPLSAGNGSIRPVWLVMGRTDRPLDCECTVVPGRDGHADGRYFVVLLDATTHELLNGAALLTDRPNLTKLGTPIRLSE